MTTIRLLFLSVKTFAKELSIQTLDLCQYNYEDFNICVAQVKSPELSLHEMCERHGKNLSDSMHKKGYDYILGIMTHFFEHDVNRADATVDHRLTTRDS